MATLYSVEGHGMLSELAQDLQPQQLEAHADAAERELGFKGTTFTGEQAETARLAVVYKINCNMARGDGGQLVQSEKSGDQARTFASSKIASANEDYCTRAHRLADELLATVAVEEPSTTSPRTSQVEHSVVW